MKELVNTETCEVVEKFYIENLINRIDEILNLQIAEAPKKEEIQKNQKIEITKTEIKAEIKKEIKNLSDTEIEDPFSAAIDDWEHENLNTDKKEKIYGFGLDDELPPFDKSHDVVCPKGRQMSADNNFEFVIDNELIDTKEEDIFFPG